MVHAVAVLLTSRAQQSVVVVPLLLLAMGGGFSLAAVKGWQTQAGWGAVLVTGAFGAFLLFLALGELAVLRIDNHRLRVWGVFRRFELAAASCAFGVRLKVGSRASRYVAFVTDGAATIDVGDWGTERGARRGIERLAEALYGGNAPTGNAGAQRVVAEVEGAWKTTMAKAQQSVDAYYRSPAWRRSGYLVLGLVAAYSIGMLLYLHFTGQR